MSVSVRKDEVRPPAKMRKRTPGANQDRKPLDAYDTPFPLALAMCKMVATNSVAEPRRILEPAAGTGVFVKAARLVWPKAAIWAVDVNGGCKGVCTNAGADGFVTADFLLLDHAKIGKADLIIGNPPYSIAEEFVLHAWESLLPGASIAFLLRLSFLASGGRWESLYPTAPLRSVWPVVPRPSFFVQGPDRGRTDMTEYGVFRWTAGWAGEFDCMRWQRGDK